MISLDDHAGINWWCSEALAHDMTVIMGVIGATGVGEVWRFDQDTCPAPLPLYRAKIGIPMVNAGWWPATGESPQHEDAEPAIPDTQWLICFEAFSLWRWIDVARSDADHVVFSQMIIGPFRSPPPYSAVKSLPNLQRSFLSTSIMRIVKNRPCGSGYDSVFSVLKILASSRDTR